MRKVRIPKDATPPADWCEDAKDVTTALRNAKSSFEREEIIEKNEKLWRDARVRDWLLSLFHGKCWYTEAQDVVSAFHVDHYRPKGRVADLMKNVREGYWWLAFDWNNYRICGQLINVKKKDLFPLDEPDVATCDDPQSLKKEAPTLIDPLTDDARLISFEMDEDGCIAVSVPGATPIETARVKATIDILGLNRLDRLNRKRADVWQDCCEKIAEYNSAADEPACMRKLRQAMSVRSLQAMAAYETELSSVAGACIMKVGPEQLKAKVYG